MLVVVDGGNGSDDFGLLWYVVTWYVVTWYMVTWYMVETHGRASLRATQKRRATHLYYVNQNYQKCLRQYSFLLEFQI